MLTPTNNLLTEKGWKNITELSVGDEILTTNFAGHGIFSPILNITEYDYDGYIYEYLEERKGARPAHFSLTEGSIVPTYDPKSRKSIRTGKVQTVYQIVNKLVDDLPDETSNIRALFSSPLIYNIDGKRHQAGVIRHGSVNMPDVDYYRLLAYVIFRTAITKGTGAKHYSWVPIISVRNRDDPTHLFELLDKYSIPYRIYIKERLNRADVGRYVVLRHGAAATRSIKRIIGTKKIAERTIPDVIMQSTSPEAITAFLVEAVRIHAVDVDLDDGRLPDHAIAFSVSNETVAAQLSELFYKVGYRGSVTIYDSPNRSSRLIQLSITSIRNATIRPAGIIKKRYTGKVYTLDVINEMAVCNPSGLNPQFAMVVKVN